MRTTLPIAHSQTGLVYTLVRRYDIFCKHRKRRVSWVQVSVCGKLTFLMLPEQSNTVAKPDLISMWVEHAEGDTVTTSDAFWHLCFLSAVQHEECFHVHVIVSRKRSSQGGIETISSTGHLKDILKERHSGWALQPFVYPCWPCMLGLRQYFPTIPSIAFSWRAQFWVQGELLYPTRIIPPA